MIFGLYFILFKIKGEFVSQVKKLVLYVVNIIMLLLNIGDFSNC